MVPLPLHIEPDPDDTEFASLFVDGSIDDRPYRLLLDNRCGAVVGGGRR